jgi:curved DNA-binding protein CbpA
MARYHDLLRGPEAKAMAERLIDIGFKKLAMQLHPDRGGSQE